MAKKYVHLSGSSPDGRVANLAARFPDGLDLLEQRLLNLVRVLEEPVDLELLIQVLDRFDGVRPRISLAPHGPRSVWLVRPALLCFLGTQNIWSGCLRG